MMNETNYGMMELMVGVVCIVDNGVSMFGEEVVG